MYHPDRNRPLLDDENSAGDSPGARLSLPEGPALLHHIARAVMRVTDADSAYVVRRLTETGRVEVLGSAGSGGPAVGTWLHMPVAAPPTRIVLPLTAGTAPLGALVAEGAAEGKAAQAAAELSLLGTAAALALQNHALLVALEAQARDIARRQYQLLSGTIYHLKNALANSSEYLELLDLEAELSERQKEYVARSRRSVSIALRLLTELHDLGMTDAGQLVPHREPLNIAALVRDIAQDHRLSAGTTTVSFVLELPALPALRTDGDCVRQIVDTLLSNAIRYSPPGGIVTVRATLVHGRRSGDPDQWLRIDVADMGPGVTEREDVFEEVQRVSRKGPPGFRLAIARRLARLMGGDLILDTAPGEGSTFSLWLPIRDE